MSDPRVIGPWPPYKRRHHAPSSKKRWAAAERELDEEYRKLRGEPEEKKAEAKSKRRPGSKWTRLSR